MTETTFTNFVNHKKILEDALDAEANFLNRKAALSKNHERQKPLEMDHRLPYKRDVDRILHSKAYARYADKTQVVYLVQNDHITHRSLHVQLVSNFSRGISEILKLNTDLVEAIALGHDVGHPPFGHEGEGYLSQLSFEFGQGHFAHPAQSCRLFTHIEPLNLGFAVYDGFLCHDGGMSGCCLKPHFNKTWENHFQEVKEKAFNPNKNFLPATLEGCLVKLCDTISYIGRDIEDAISLGILDRSIVPKTILGNSNGEILSRLACDVIEQSYGKDYIALSEEAYQALVTLRLFNFKNIYRHPKLKVESTKIRKAYRLLFIQLLEDLHSFGEKSYIWKNYIHNKPEEYRQSLDPVKGVIDYISGMTDKYFIRTLENLVIPQQIEIK
ncbi:Deoxyguanosinetriphosphate triphosphohydrolase-like protein [Chlamydiales bacterium STE3]|nr:Deoxyguanosinetriphosphate triphosphohydrolase-like protein [Chlamydiales bacterium STE3]